MKKIQIKGAIISNDDKWIYDLFEYESTCPNDVSSQMEALDGEDIQVIINSGGGSVYDASEIYTELRSYEGNVEGRIVGIAASAASVIAMGCKVLKISPTAEIMIHNASTLAYGDHNDMDKAAESLRTTNKSIAHAYRDKSGLDDAVLLGLMEKETWMTAEEAKEYGFVDEILFQDEQVRLVASAPGALPQQVLNKVRNDVLKKPDTVPMDEIKNIFAESEERITNSVLEKLSEKKEKEPPAVRNSMERFLF